MIRRLHSYKEDINDTVKQFSDFLKSYNIDFTIIGGIAVGINGYNRYTDDIDILVASSDKDKMDNLPIGYIKKISNKTFIFHEPKIEINVIYSGEKAGSSEGIVFVLPEDISENINGIPVISLKFLIVYKIASGIYGNRIKDLGDVQELIQIHKLSKDFINGQRQDLVNKYYEIWEMTG